MATMCYREIEISAPVFECWQGIFAIIDANGLGRETRGPAVPRNNSAARSNLRRKRLHEDEKREKSNYSSSKFARTDGRTDGVTPTLDIREQE